ncbi:MAG: NAD-dependent epimerase/dehydratase family protein [Candidatus Aminicenantaceae bacterium]
MSVNIIEKDCKDVLESFDDVKTLYGKNFLITGSNGLIGHYFSVLLDMANRLYDMNIKAYLISKHPPIWKNNSFTFITKDLSKPFSLRHSIDFVIHGACYGRPKKFLENEFETIALNINATKSLLDIAKENMASFLFLSTSEIYGNPPPEEIPTKETYAGNSKTWSSRAAYVESKRMGEVLCFIYNRKFNVDARVARLALVYGPGISINDERVMGSFIKKALLDKHIQLIDAGESRRTYCYITDAIVMLLNILLKGKERVYNVGGVETISILELAQLVAKQCGATFAATSGEGIKDAPGIVCLNVSRVLKEFGLEKFTPLADGLARTIEWNIQQQKVKNE